MTPRLTIGAVTGETELARAFAQAGHVLRAVDTPEDVKHVDLVLLDTSDTGWIARSVDALEPFVRPRQMFIHTALSEGTQLLDAVETRGAVVMAAHNMWANHWVTSAADELGETVIGLLVAELGGVSHPISDSQRLGVAAALRLMALERVVRRDAFQLLRSAVESADAFEDDFVHGEPVALGSADPAVLEQMHRVIEEPGVARLFADLERRHAERTGDAEIELWAISTADKDCT
ncbi:hypothetical protein G7Y29_09195 [Corynebacterium qintianiae]|uniref:CGL2689-like C-terminal domain-containing protein n=1 Tax=Corynebacterium qintianiae TaxID=2709392 RepID=A0A7T0KMA8_9CORY|nr:hypothetical protein [Corynebacterium qintianiae]QPK83006.1 hypothetical protein G7Y29_09195 [Corynebacterium qintianiae]